MAHYFTNEPGRDTPCLIVFDLDGKTFKLHSNSGVFSKDRLDTGTRILLETLLKKQAPVKSLFDIGCGIGAIGVVLSSFWKAKIYGSDVNEKAVRLARENLREVKADYEIYLQDGIIQPRQFPLIVINPPIRAGKKVIYHLFEEGIEHLSEDGSLWIVIRKQHGAESALRFLNEIATARRVEREKGFWIIQAQKRK